MEHSRDSLIEFINIYYPPTEDSCGTVNDNGDPDFAAFFEAYYKWLKEDGNGKENKEVATKIK